jgi:hypothetical protein
MRIQQTATGAGGRTTVNGSLIDFVIKEILYLLQELMVQQE